MANFSVHVSVAAAASLALAGLAEQLHLITKAELPYLLTLGTVGGLLPDIDADNSRPTRMLFSSLALVAMWLTANLLEHRLASHWVLAVAAGNYLLVRYGMFTVFNRLTSHRGVFHTLVAAAFFGLLTLCVAHYALYWPGTRAWLAGVAVTSGFVVHLLLDELYSIDLAGRRLKKSFGTALKLYHGENPVGSVVLLLLALGLAWLAPPSAPLWQALATAPWRQVLPLR